MQDITLSSGTRVTHVRHNDSTWEAIVCGAQREMTAAEWTEYARRMKLSRSRDIRAARKAKYAASLAAFARTQSTNG